MKPRAWWFLAALLAAQPARGQVPTPGRPPAPAAPGGLPTRADSPPVEHLTSFDYQTAEVRWQDGRWLLRAGGTVLKDFGRREADAREALRIVRALHLTEHGTVGTPRPVLEYWLSRGHAPSGLVPGLWTLTFDPAALRVQQREGQWCLADERQVLFVFGVHPEEARQALAIIQHHRFNQVGYVGQGTPAMIYFLAGPGPSSGTVSNSRMASPASIVPRRQESIPAAQQAVRFEEINRLVHPHPITPAVLPVGRQLPVPAFRAPQETPAGIERVALDWRQVRMWYKRPNWELISAGHVLADFGPREDQARQALTLIQAYRPTEQYRVGGPVPSFTFYLGSGPVPYSLRFRAAPVTFRPETLAVQPFGNEFVLTDGNQALLRFSDETAARSVLQVVRQSHCDSLCRVNSGADGGLTFFGRSRG